MIYFAIRLFQLLWRVKITKSKFTKYNSGYRKRKEGDVKLDINPQKKKKFSKDDGEYVDYEDV